MCKCAMAFVLTWQLALAEGKKGPRLLITGGEPPAPEDTPTVGDEPVSAADKAKGTMLLGSLVDPPLSFLSALRTMLAPVRAEAPKKFAKLQNNGFGLPMQARALGGRVEGAVLPGTESIASCTLGCKAYTNST